MFRITRLVLLVAFLALPLSLQAADEKPIRMLISGGGDWHPYAQCSGAFIDAVRKKGNISCSYSEDVRSLRKNHLKQFDVLVIYNGVYYKGEGDGQKVPTPKGIPESITEFVKNGGGLICVHSGMASFSDWPGYFDLIGGVWVWGTSKHDAYGTLKSNVVADHPIVKGLPKTFEFQDEFYHTLKLRSDIKILIESTHEKNGKTVTEPLAWVSKDTPKERVAVILHGHDMGSWGDPNMQQLMTQAVEWAGHRR